MFLAYRMFKLDNKFIRLEQIDNIERLNSFECVKIEAGKEAAYILSKGIICSTDTFITNQEQMLLFDKSTNSIRSISIADVHKGDVVLTSSNGFKKISKIDKKVLRGYRMFLKTGMFITMSENTKFAVYDTLTKDYVLVDVAIINADIDRYRVVLNQLTTCRQQDFTIEKTEHDKYDYHLTIDRIGDMFASAAHTFLVFDTKKKAYKMVKTKDLNTEIHKMGVRFE